MTPTYPYDDDDEIETDDDEPEYYEDSDDDDEPEEDDEDSEDEDEDEYDDDESDDDEAPDEDEPEAVAADDEEIVANVERAFRGERARIRACESLVELREIRATYEDHAVSLPHVAQRIRARDLVEIADDRITSLKAARLARRGR